MIFAYGAGAGAGAGSAGAGAGSAGAGAGSAGAGAAAGASAGAGAGAFWLHATSKVAVASAARILKDFICDSYAGKKMKAGFRIGVY
jgi:hypothetical protein